MIFASLLHVCRALEIVDRFSRHEACGETGFVFNRRKNVSNTTSLDTHLSAPTGVSMYIRYVSLLFSFEAAAVFEQEKLCRQKAWGTLIFLLVVSDSSNASQS